MGDSASASPRPGDKVLVDWTGVTIGYQGRFFQTRNKPKGGAFADDGFSVDYLTFNVGDGTVIPGIDEAVRSMKPGGIRRLIVPEEVSTHHQQYIELLPCGLSHFVAKRDH